MEEPVSIMATGVVADLYGQHINQRERGMAHFSLLSEPSHLRDLSHGNAAALAAVWKILGLLPGRLGWCRGRGGLGVFDQPPSGRQGLGMDQH